MRIIPAMDIIKGKVVRLKGGDFQQATFYDKEPVQWARDLEAAGIQSLHFVDLDGAKQGTPQNLDVLQQINRSTSLQIDVGGGLRNRDSIENVLKTGAAQITAGSVAVSEPETVLSWLDEFGPSRIILGLDLRDGYVATHGWQEKSDLHWRNFLDSYYEKGLRKVICTDIQRDGNLEGPALSLYRDILSTFPDLHLIASGGISSREDLEELKRAGLSGAIVGKALYEGNIGLNEITELNKSKR